MYFISHLIRHFIEEQHLARVPKGGMCKSLLLSKSLRNGVGVAGGVLASLPNCFHLCSQAISLCAQAQFPLCSLEEEPSGQWAKGPWGNHHLLISAIARAKWRDSFSLKFSSLLLFYEVSVATQEGPSLPLKVVVPRSVNIVREAAGRREVALCKPLISISQVFVILWFCDKILGSW
jgi:hypothetical protein